MFSPCQGYRIEGLTDGDSNWSNQPVDPNLKVMPSIYRQNFYGKPHKTYMSYYSPLGPTSISVKKEKDEYYLLICTEKGFEEVRVPKATVYRPTGRKVLGMKPKSLHVITSVRPELTNYNLSKVAGKNIQDELLKVYEPEFSKVMKVGILYCKDGHHDENEMLKNISVNSSPEYIEFLNFLGEKVELKDFKNYSGGLDITNNSSGTHSIFSKYKDVEIMYHVSTMLPFFPSDPKQTERRKHICNDRIVIVFNDGKQAYNPNCIKSKNTQIIILVQPIKPIENSTIGISNDERKCDDTTPISSPVINNPGSPNINSSGTRYKVSIANKNEVPGYGPALPDAPVFNKDEAFRNFLYEKMIAGASSLRNSPVFTGKAQSDKAAVFLNIINKYSKNPTTTIEPL
ncbi:hypothetical protein DICPUDRAFT_46913 [Dictyostelium purpureum]|uniref:Rap-GAP domain-containing protein n=1 Tax=Dictyostelium purpureum TaxID=5786 RepID=F0ZGV9_DICPU|nr:uncharacterized protein DICPUDRAFT_46913 [Dictyostelium purpureum]EGC36856.1 hypothetical protein DICPUDRAFT_46913 [Dictyostelium purpureum]|eukprot:XP_003286654.1 hypothetical protein DICPUDRAFT_46913 [Dictyostelium purpureum]